MLRRPKGIRRDAHASPDAHIRQLLQGTARRASTRHPARAKRVRPARQIGRASCRGRGEISVVAGSFKKKKKKMGGVRGMEKKKGKVTKKQKKDINSKGDEIIYTGSEQNNKRVMLGKKEMTSIESKSVV